MKNLVAVIVVVLVLSGIGIGYGILTQEKESNPVILEKIEVNSYGG